MKFSKIIYIIAFVCTAMISCKSETKKEGAVEKVSKTELAANVKEISLNISGMTCELGCAKNIASKLSKKEGVLDAKVIFSDSLATVKYDANKVNKAELIAFVDGVAGGNIYRTSEISKKECKKECKANCKKTNCTAKEIKNCKIDCKKACCTTKESKKCETGCKKACCAVKKMEEKVCKTNCKKKCCAKEKKV